MQDGTVLCDNTVDERELAGDPLAVAHDLGIPTSVAADRIVEQRLAQGRRERTSNGASAADASGNPATSIAGVVAQPH